ncbi:BRO1-like domain-containing protein [Aspergillus californicus]
MTSNIHQIPFRRSHTVSLSAALTQYISSKYDQRPDMFAEDLLILDRLRSEAVNVQEPHVSGISRLVTYAAQLKWLGGKFPVDVGVEFPWYTAFGFNTTRPVSQDNIRFELANIIFNLSSLYSQLAFSSNRTTSDGLKQACNYLCQAAGVIKHLRTDIVPDMRSAPPDDMDEMTLQSLEQLLLAQAQECFWQKAVQDGLKDASIARLAAKVSDYYADACEYAVKSNAIGTDWIHHMTAKQHHFSAAAQFRQSLDCLEKRKYGEEVARLRDAVACVNEALKESRWINRTVLGDLEGLKKRVQDDLKRAEKDNDLIYLNSVPPKSELRLIDRASMVAAKAPPQVTDAISMLGDKGPLGQPLFSKLVPYAVHIAASIYSDRRDRLVNEQIIGELETMTDKLRDLLSSLNLPGSLQALEKPLGLPPTLVSHAEEMRQQDGLYRLRKSLQDIANVKSNDQAIYTEGVELLAAEKAEDDASRRKYGTDRWSRESSTAAAPKLHTTSQEINGYFSSAQSSDNLVEQKLRDSEAVFRVLTGTNRDLEAYVPSSRRATIPPEVEREVSRLRNCISEVNRLESRRKRKASSVKDKARGDDISSALVREAARLERDFPMQAIQASQFEDLFDHRLHDYDVDLQMVAEEQNDQDQISAQVREANRAFTRAHTGDASTREREKALQELENGYLKYKEIISNIEVGRKFYNDLAKIVGRFRDDVKAFVHKRRMEGSSLEQDISSVVSMASLNISPIRQSSKPQSQPQPQPVHHQPTHHQQSPPFQFQPLQQHQNQLPGSFPAQQQISQPNPQQLPTPTTSISRSDREPLTAPQPTRSVPKMTPGMWSPEMGIRFGPAPGQSQPGNQTQLPVPQAQTGQTWDPSRGVNFS